MIAEFRLSSTQEIKRWIMTFGPSAVVLEPEELVQEIHHDLSRMIVKYSASTAVAR